MADYITLKELSNKLSMDRSHLRKYILAKKIIPEKIRTVESRGQLTLAVTSAQAQSIVQARENEGFIQNVAVTNGYGHFYIIKIIPEFDSRRVKLGFANNPEERLRAHKTVAPTAELVKAWACKKHWEGTVMDSVTREGCESIGGEVFNCDSVSELIKRCDEFFHIMPK